MFNQDSYQVQARLSAINPCMLPSGRIELSTEFEADDDLYRFRIDTMDLYKHLCGKHGTMIIGESYLLTMIADDQVAAITPPSAITVTQYSPYNVPKHCPACNAPLYQTAYTSALLCSNRGGCPAQVAELTKNILNTANYRYGWNVPEDIITDIAAAVDCLGQAHETMLDVLCKDKYNSIKTKNESLLKDFDAVKAVLCKLQALSTLEYVNLVKAATGVHVI